MADPDNETEATDKAGPAPAGVAPAETSEAAALAEVSEAAEAATDEEAWAETQLDGDYDTVNDQLIDTIAVVQGAVDEPSLAGASLAQIRGQAVGLALLNAVNAQQNAYVTANATVLAAVTRILALGGGPASKAARSDQGANAGG